MRRVAAFTFLFFWAASAVAGAADDVAVADIVGDSAAFDAAVIGEISVRGELVGDFQRRGGWVWVQLNDDPYVDAPLRDGGTAAGSNVGVGVRIATGAFDGLEVTDPGGYRVRGPIVRVVGVWRHHDASRGGESYFDAASVDLLSGEHQLEEGAHGVALLAGIVLLVIAGLGALWRRR